MGEVMANTLRALFAMLLTATALVAAPAAAKAASDDPAEVLVGRWVGSYSGYVDGRYVKGREKIVITEAQGYAAKGTWQYKSGNDRWSAPLPVQFIISIDADGVVGVRGVDGEGVYDGELVSANRLVVSYSDPQPQMQALRLSVRRR